MGEKSPFRRFVALMRECIDKGDKGAPTAEEFQAAVKGWGPSSLDAAHYLFARLLQKRGHAERAAEHFRQCVADSSSPFNPAPALAGLAQREVEKK